MTKSFITQSEAVASAMKMRRGTKPSRIVVLNKNGQVVDRREFGTVKIQQPPKKESIASKKIRAAGGGVILDRLRSGVAQNS